MITEQAMREVEAMVERARLGGDPPMSLELRQTLKELVSYYKAGHDLDARREFRPRLEVSDDGETWRELGQVLSDRLARRAAEVGEESARVALEQSPATDRNRLQQVEKSVGEAAHAAEPCDHAVTRLDDAGDLRCVACGSRFVTGCTFFPPLEPGADYEVRLRAGSGFVFGAPAGLFRGAKIHGLPEDGE